MKLLIFCRRFFKGLLLLVYLLKNGSEKVVTSAREHVYDLRGLESFSFIDENGKDQGVNSTNTHLKFICLIWLLEVKYQKDQKISRKNFVLLVMFFIIYKSLLIVKYTLSSLDFNVQMCVLIN